ncbi:PP2C family serine/threonine-protein phosphatase [Streptomyces sp. NPDC006552]|uniref:PP2C family serine/threonine-protein phosphatase n=1 Tax=Streptomyces sp. NPDC006552 TaxID=3157179 RepID=UPI0033BE8D19
MSQCPSCEEPLDKGDRFCGACGFDLSSEPPVPGAFPPGAEQGAGVEWPDAPEPAGAEAPAPVHLPTDLVGTESGGGELPTMARPQGPAGSGAGMNDPAAWPNGPAAGADTPAAPAAGPTAGPAGRADGSGAGFDGSGAGADAPPDGDFALAAPDPRAVAPAELEGATPPADTKRCVACRAGQVDADGYCENCGHAQPRERDHMEQELGAVAAVSDRGLRHHRNEDAFAISSAALPDGSPAVVAVVCDGVSSATRPDDASLAASRAADEALHASLPRGTHPQQAMHEAIVAAAESVNALAREPETAREHQPHQNAPACTFVGSIITRDLLVVGWIGDSRVYWVPDDRATPAARLTEDDSWAAQMVAAGLMNEAEAYADERAHAITGWLGADAYELEPHTASFKPDRPGVVVVCTDGLWNYAEGAEEMARVVPADAARRPLHCAQVLVGHALDGGGHDNVTVAVLPFPVPPQGAGSA